MPGILLHACCGPCSIFPARTLLNEGLQPGLFFFNPNIQPLAEYLRRRESAVLAAAHLGCEIALADDAWDIEAWLALQLPFAKTAERCERCIAARMRATAERAVAQNIPLFSTTLLYSRYQPHEFIREYGMSLEQELPVRFFYEDFRKGWQEGIDLSIAWGLYRQPYCGCIFSESERYAKKLARLKKNRGVRAV